MTTTASNTTIHNTQYKEMAWMVGKPSICEATWCEKGQTTYYRCSTRVIKGTHFCYAHRNRTMETNNANQPQA